MKKYLMLIFLTISSCLLAGCADMIEIQDRDFVLALGISCDTDSYTFTYALPDLTQTGGTSEEGSRLIRTYSGASFPEIEDLYNRGSDRRLDYRHLQVIVLDSTISEDPDKFSDFLRYINENNEISRNVLVYYSDNTARELFEYDESLNNSIGDYIKNLDTNNSDRFDLTPVTTGDFIDGMYSSVSLIIPRLTLADASINLDGSAVFFGNQLLETISDTQTILWRIMEGTGKDYVIYLPEGQSLQLNQVKSSYTYRYRDNQPVITLDISGSATLLSERADDTSERYINKALNSWLEEQCKEELHWFMKERGIDYLNLYQKSSIKSREIWLTYEDRLADFTEDAAVTIQADFKLQ